MKITNIAIMIKIIVRNYNTLQKFYYKLLTNKNKYNTREDFFILFYPKISTIQSYKKIYPKTPKKEMKGKTKLKKLGLSFSNITCISFMYIVLATSREPKYVSYLRNGTSPYYKVDI